MNKTVEDIIRNAVTKAAAMDTARSDENEADVKNNIVNSVDGTDASTIVGSVAKQEIVKMTGAEATSDEGTTCMPQDENDGDAFKSASALAGAAAGILARITTETAKAAATDAIDVEAAENAGTSIDTPDLVGEEEDVTRAGEAGSAKKAAFDAGREYAEQLLLKEAGYKFAQEADEEAELESILGEAAGAGEEDAESVGSYLDAYDQAPGMEAGPEEGAEGLPGAEDMPDAGGEEQAADELAQVMAEAGITPEELQQLMGGADASEEVKEASVKWASMSVSARRKLVLDSLKSEYAVS